MVKKKAGRPGKHGIHMRRVRKGVQVAFVGPRAIRYVKINAGGKPAKIMIVDLPLTDSNGDPLTGWLHALKEAGHEIVAFFDHHEGASRAMAAMRELFPKAEIIVRPRSEAPSCAGVVPNGIAERLGVTHVIASNDADGAFSVARAFGRLDPVTIRDADIADTGFQDLSGMTYCGERCTEAIRATPRGKEGLYDVTRWLLSCKHGRPGAWNAVDRHARRFRDVVVPATADVVEEGLFVEEFGVLVVFLSATRLGEEPKTELTEATCQAMFRGLPDTDENLRTVVVWVTADDEARSTCVSRNGMPDIRAAFGVEHLLQARFTVAVDGEGFIERLRDWHDAGNPVLPE